MQQTNISILSTRPVSPALITEAAAKGIQLEVLSFIETTPADPQKINRPVAQWAQQHCTVIFTSMNAVTAVQECLEQPPRWDIYCIGHTTQQQAADFFGPTAIKATANSATQLAQKIIEKQTIQQAVFFCGDQRRDELPQLLRAHNIQLDEITVYHTVHTPHIIEKQYEGIAFFSPSAVHSFFSSNAVQEGCVLFAIGETTAAAIQQYSPNQVVTGETPAKEQLIRQAIGYFCNA